MSNSQAGSEPCSPSLQARAAAGFRPDPFTYSALISGFGKAGRLKDALQALQDARNEQVLNLVVFNAALDACQRCRDSEVGLCLALLFSGPAAQAGCRSGCFLPRHSQI